MSALLLCGLILELPILIWALRDSLTGRGLSEDLPNAVFASWVILGPSGCALHALWRGRRSAGHGTRFRDLAEDRD